jgi:hypothetical protein
MGFGDNNDHEPSESSSTEGEDQQHDSADAVAARLRDRVRAQAAALLDKVDVSVNLRNSGGAGSQLTSRHASSSNSLDKESKEGDDVNSPRSGGGSAMGTAGDDSKNTPGGGATSPLSGSSTGELTKRLQKLALERQKESKDRLKVIQADTSSHLSSVKTFQELNLPKHLLDAIFAMGFDRPSAIQEEALPRILADPARNLIGQAQSG